MFANLNSAPSTHVRNDVLWGESQQVAAVTDVDVDDAAVVVDDAVDVVALPLARHQLKRFVLLVFAHVR